MNHDHTRGPGWTLLVCSLAVNIFLVAFLLGRATMPSPPMGPEHGPPPFGMGMPPHGGFGGPPGPPFMGPSSVFSPQEMEQQFSALQDHFKAMNAQRAAFADKLEAGPVSREDVIAHLIAVEQAMDTVKSAMRPKIADKISAMGPEDRHRLAEALRHEGPPPRPPCKP